MNLGERVKYLRLVQELTQAQVADRAGCRTSYVSMIEVGGSKNPTLDSLEKIAEGLGVSICRLLEDYPREAKEIPERIMAYVTNEEFLPYMEAAIEA
ncbi:MAG: helix-turn-helix domain-containing protein, partial [Bacillota bacterium]